MMARSMFFYAVVASMMQTSMAWTCSRSSDLRMAATEITPKATRRAFVQAATSTIIGGAASAFVAVPAPAAFAETLAEGSTTKTASGVAIKVIKSGGGEQPRVGELMGIRFKAFAGKTKIDDIFDTPEPYYTRCGSGGLIKGVEEVLPMMKLGDRWELTVPSKLAFGSKGRSASAGRPRIPADIDVVFEVEVVALPGREPELIELIGDV